MFKDYAKENWMVFTASLITSILLVVGGAEACMMFGLETLPMEVEPVVAGAAGYGSNKLFTDFKTLINGFKRRNKK